MIISIIFTLGESYSPKNFLQDTHVHPFLISSMAVVPLMTVMEHCCENCAPPLTCWGGGNINGSGGCGGTNDCCCGCGNCWGGTCNGSPVLGSLNSIGGGWLILRSLLVFSRCRSLLCFFFFFCVCETPLSFDFFHILNREKINGILSFVGLNLDVLWDSKGFTDSVLN